MSWWDGYRAVYGAELRAAAHEFADHGWPLVEAPEGLFLRTGGALDVIEVPATVGRGVCARLRASADVVPVAATPTGRWLFPVGTGGVVHPLLHAGTVLHTAGATVLAPPSELPDGWVHWRVPPGYSAYRVPPAELILHAVADVVRRRGDHDSHGIHGDHDERPGTQRSAAGVAVGTRP
ncbi:MAG TPA: bifunctional DNA primase/polymerase [Pseudonocardia sp.]|nr:bifunctional DNA primase/polymerase [Pseudonocardia sp.]